MVSPKIERLIKLADEAGVLDDDGTKKILLAAAMDDSDGLADELEEILSHKAFPKLVSGDPFYQHPDQKEIHGDFVFGTVGTNSFGLNESEMLQHMLVVGRSGSGKTNCSFIIIKEFLKKGKPFLVFDWKRNYRDLLLDEDDILVFTVGRNVCPFGFNPLIPPKGTAPTVWLKKLIEVMAHAYFLGEGVAYLLQKAIDQVYREHGVYDGSDNYPTLADVLRFLENYKVKGREVGWMASALRAVGTLCFGEMGIVLNTRKSLMVKDLLDRNVVLELDGLTNSDKAFFTEALLLHIHHFRLAEERREVFKHAIIVEEAHHIFLRKKQEITGEEAITDVIMREIRELGEGMIIIDQHPSMLSKPALGNTYAAICFNLKGRGDVETIAGSMMLDSEQKEQLANIEVGTGIVKLQGRCTKPFSVRFPLISLRKGSVTDQALKDKMAGFYAKMGSFRAEPAESSSVSAVPGILKDQEGTVEKVKISEKEIELLECISRNPVACISESYRKAKLNAYHGNNAKRALIQNGLVNEVKVARSKGYVKVLELTEKGIELLRELGHEVAGSTNRKGGAIHRYWEQKIAEHYSKLGYQTFVEKGIGKGKAVDVVAEREGERIAIEISTAQSDEAWNVRKDLEAGFEKILIVCVSKDAAERVKKQLEQANIACESVQIALAKDFDQGSGTEERGE